MNRSYFRRLINLQAGQGGSWYRIIRNLGSAAQVMIYDEVGFLGVSASDFVSDLLLINGDVDVHISSPGGEIFDGLAIYNALASRDGTVSVTVDALAASIASVIAMAASPGKLTMAPNATMMIHEGFGMCVGDAADMRQTADVLDKQSQIIAGIYATRAGKTAAHWRSLMQAETWLTAREAVEAGLADHVGAGKAAADKDIAARWDLSFFAHTPARLLRSHLPPENATWDPDGDGDDDSTPEGDTDHDHWAPDGTQLKPVPGKPMPMDHTGRFLRNASTDTSAWDASKAWHNGAESDDPATFYAGICAGEKTGDKSTQAAWALPHHYHPGDPPNEAGTRNAMSRLPQTQGLTNEAAARAHLEAHMKAINPDYEPASSDYFDPDLFRSAMEGLA